MRVAGKILGQVLSELETYIAPGMTTLQVDQFAEKRIIELGGIPAFKGYHGFPATICANVNEQVVHGIPNNYVLQENDIFTVDCGVIFKNFYSDSAITLVIGNNPNPEKKAFVDTAYRALDAAIDSIKPGVNTNVISAAIESIIKPAGYSIVRDLSGHGIGTNLHEDPYILNFHDQKEPGVTLQPGMTLAIEPIITMGKGDIITLSDNWTIVSKDRSLAAQVEHTVLITEQGAEILTKRAK